MSQLAMQCAIINSTIIKSMSFLQFDHVNFRTELNKCLENESF